MRVQETTMEKLEQPEMNHSASSAWDDRRWNRLLKSIEEGQVVPVIGPQLLIMGAERQRKTLQRMMAEQLLRLRDIDPLQVGLHPGRELHDAVTLLKGDAGINLQDVYGDVSDALDMIAAAPGFQMPPALVQLSEISDFRLMVTLSPDFLLARALKARRAANEIIHSPYLPTSEAVDLAPDWLKRTGETHLLYLFGKVKSTPVYAIHDEDILEYAHNLLVRGSNVPVRFLGELQQRNLLLLGCNFPDWLSRFFMRLTNQTRLADKKTRAWLVEDIESQPGLTLFLKSFSRETEVLSDLAPEAFVAELHRRWLARRTPSDEAAGTTLPAPRATLFFISYSRATDLPAAQKLFESLRQQGVGENEIWFDRTAIEPGQDFQDRILDGIRSCRYFLPLISSAADRMDEKFFRREWKRASERSEAISGRDFVVPLIVDADYDPLAYQRVPRDWTDHIDFGHAPGGVPDPRTRNRLNKLIRDERRSVPDADS
ncbi:MAG: toll/interleukin-1 receptor domain-containing protein [Gammaproteobacteria bacterium]